MRYIELLSEEQLDELNMSPSTLQKWSNSPEAEGIRAGFEAEMIFRNTKRDEDEYDQEPDYDYDRRANDIEDVIDFFSNDDYGYGLSPRGARNLRESLWEEYNEWVNEQISESWDDEAEDQVRDYMETNVWGDDSEREDRIRTKVEDMFPDDDADDIMAAGDAAPRFTRSSDQEEYVKENNLYAKYKEAYDTAHEEFEQEVINEYESQGNYYDQAREYYSDMMREGSDYDESDFLRERYGYMGEISNSHSLDWPYWTGGGQGGGDREWSDIASDLEMVVGMEVRVGSGYHSITRKDDRWIIEPDGSLEPDDDEDMGLEIVSPPMPLKTALEKLEAVVNWGNSDAYAYTNDSTGLHMGVSIPFVGGDVDYVKLILFMGDQYVLEKFGRIGNHFCDSAMKKLKQNVLGARNRRLREANFDAAAAMQLIKNNLIELAQRYVQDGVGVSKYTSAHIKDGYIEFRSPGGDYLNIGSGEGGISELQNTMLRFARAMFIASRPDLDRKEYAKKLVKLLGTGGEVNDSLKLFSDFAAGTIDKTELKRRWAEEVLSKDAPEEVKKSTWQIINLNTGKDVTGHQYSGYTRLDALERAKSEISPGSSMTDFMKNYAAIDLDANTGEWSVIDRNTKEIITVVAADDRNQAVDKVRDEMEQTGHKEFYVRPHHNFEKEKPKLSRRVQVAKRIKEPKVTPSVAADNEKDSQQIQARLGEPQPAGAVRDTGYYRVTWNERRNGRVVSDALNVDAENANAAMDRVRSALQAQGREAIQIEANPQEPPAWRRNLNQFLHQHRANSQGEFTGQWRVINRAGDEVYRFGGVGNNQADANRTAQTWLISQGDRLENQGPFDVVPETR